MANVLKFSLVKEVELDKNLIPVECDRVSLYAKVDGLSAWVAYVDSYEEATQKIQPDVLDELFSQSLSGLELEEIYGVLSITKQYCFYDEEFEYGSDKVEQKEEETQE